MTWVYVLAIAAALVALSAWLITHDDWWESRRG